KLAGDVRIACGQPPARLDQRERRIGQRRRQPSAAGLASLGEGDLGGRVEPLVAEQLGAQQRTVALFTTGAGPAVRATRSVERGGGSLGGRGGLAQRYGLARASCDLAPDDGGLKQPLRAVPGPHPAGGDVRRLAFAAQQGELEELQKRLVPAGQPIPQGPDGLGAEQPLKLTPELEHAPNSG